MGRRGAALRVRRRPTWVDLTIATPGGTHVARVELEQPLGHQDEVVKALFGLVRRARTASGEQGQTSPERRRHVRDERGLPRDAVSLVGCWRRSDAPRG